MRNGSCLQYRIGGLIWICAFQFFVAQVLAQSQWTTPFSLKTNFISDLGNTICAIYPVLNGDYVCSPWHAVMNASFVLQGLIIFGGATFVRHALQKHYGTVAYVLMVLTAIGLIGVGVFPENENHRAHILSAGAQFITGNAAMVVIGVACMVARRWRAFAWFSAIFGITGLLATWLFTNDYGLGLGVGGMERVAAYTLPIYLIVAGLISTLKCNTVHKINGPKHR